MLGGTFASCITLLLFTHHLVVCCRKHLPQVLSFHQFERPAMMVRARRGEIGGEQQEALASPGVVQFTRESAWKVPDAITR